MLHDHANHLGIQFAQDRRRFGAAPLIDLTLTLPDFKQQFNGIVASDKFCMTRMRTLDLSWRRGVPPARTEQ